ncbi:putative mannosyl-oligosaccharide alpha-1,2-mannosidase [Acephala macrosclerotiorum]|nr:putative mannosyl-oligosaccharide alpha-1,2-mannosidase [Acephala macrosclerotiorum]
MSRASTIPSLISKRPRYKIQATFPPESATARTTRLERRDAIKAAMNHTWTGYKQNAWLHDELRPLSGIPKTSFGGWGATLVDGLDTLYIMGMIDEFEEALNGLETIDFSTPNVVRIPVFEVTIRYLGGLLGAWDISGHRYPILVEKATQLGDLLYGAFNTDSGIPVPYYLWNNTHAGKIPGPHLGVSLAEIGSLTLEFIRLSQVTRDKKYGNAVQKITDALAKTQNSTALPGMWPNMANYDTDIGGLSFSSRAFTLGASADSAYEYLPKTHLILPPMAAQQYLDMYRDAFVCFSKNLFFRPLLPDEPDILFPGAFKMWNIDTQPPLDTEMSHLACFVGGMVALGSKINDSPDEFEMARKLTDGCVWAYNNSPSGIMPERFHLFSCPETEQCKRAGEGSAFDGVLDPSYQLRPEAIESVFIMYRLTAGTSWQEKGWKMFQAIETHARTKFAYAKLKNVVDSQISQEDEMESFWLAETLKYFFLLFSEPNLVSLDDFVFNTEAHPLKQWGM